MDIPLRRLATTTAEIDHLNDLAEQCEVQAKAATMLARRIHTYARQHPVKAVLVMDRLREVVNDVGLYACLAGIHKTAVRLSESALARSSLPTPA